VPMFDDEHVESIGAVAVAAILSLVLVAGLIVMFGVWSALR